MTKSIVRSVKQTLVRLINLSLAAIIGLSSLVAATPLIFSASASALSNTLEVGVGQPYSTIQSAINAASSGDTINIAAGTYVENLIISKALTLSGAGQGLTVIEPAVSSPNPCSGSTLCGSSSSASNVILTQASDITIHDLTVEGNNPNLTSGVVRNGADVDARNGIVEDYTIGTAFNNLTVYNTTVKDIYLRGIYASSGGSGFNIHNNTVTNVEGDGSSIGMFAYGATGVFTHNTVSLTYDAISANHSRGIQFLNNTVNNSDSGIHTDNSGDGGTGNDLIQGNTITNGTTSSVDTSSYGVWVFVPYRQVTVDNNTVNSVNYGLATFGQGAAVTTLFTNNHIDINHLASSYGAYVTTDQLGYGTQNVSASFTGNTISNAVNGFYVESPGGKTATVTAHTNTITGNTTAYNNASSTTQDATSNYWGLVHPAFESIIIGSVTHNPWYSNASKTTKIYQVGAGETYTTIQAAINDAAAGDTINVAAGTYTESPNITKSVTLQSTGGRDVTTIALQTGPTYLGSLTIAASNVTVNGFTILGLSASGSNPVNASTNVFLNAGVSNVTLSNNKMIVGQVDTSPTGEDGIGILTTYTTSNVGDNFNVTGNIFQPLDGHHGFRVYSINPGIDHFTFSGNTITGNFTATALAQAKNSVIQNNTITGVGAAGSRSAGFSTWGYPDATVWGHATFSGNTITGTRRAISIYETNNVTVNGNNLSGNGTGVWVGDSQPITFDVTTISITNNNLGSEDNFGVENKMATKLNAENNYWGSVHPISTSIISGNVDYTPWYPNLARTVLSNTVPVISLVGDSSISVYQGAAYTDSGATATDNQGATITVNTTNLPDINKVGTYTVDFNAVDSFGNNATTVTRTVKVLEKKVTQTVIAPTNTVSTTSPQIVIGANAPKTSTITVPAGVTNASLDVAAILTTTTSGTKTATLSGGINVNSTTSAGQVTVALPAGTTITGAAGWDGTLNLPKIVNTTVTLPSKTGSTPTSVSSIEVGFGDVALSFSQPVRLVFAGKAGKQIGWSRSGVFSLITAVCTSDSVSGMPAGANECKIDVGADMAVWTKHFTTFTTYAQSPTYKVVAGDTLFSIGARASVDWRLIASDNNINFPYVIYPGQVLALPDGTVVAASSKVATSQVTAPAVLGATSSPQVGTAISTVVGKTAVATSTVKANWFNWNWFYAGASIVLLAVIYYAYIAADKKNKN